MSRRARQKATHQYINKGATSLAHSTYQLLFSSRGTLRQWKAGYSVVSDRQCRRFRTSSMWWPYIRHYVANVLSMWLGTVVFFRWQELSEESLEAAGNGISLLTDISSSHVSVPSKLTCANVRGWWLSLAGFVDQVHLRFMWADVPSCHGISSVTRLQSENISILAAFLRAYFTDRISYSHTSYLQHLFAYSSYLLEYQY